MLSASSGVLASLLWIISLPFFGSFDGNWREAFRICGFVLYVLNSNFFGICISIFFIDKPVSLSIYFSPALLFSFSLSRLSRLHLLDLARVASGFRSRAAAEPLRHFARNLSLWPFRHLHSISISQTMQTPLIVRRRATCPCLQGFPVKYRERPFAFAALLDKISGAIAVSSRHFGG
jgi:hypothetical protein